MVGLSASWNVSGPQSGRAVISSDWLTEMKSFPAFLVCSLIAICTCAARPPTMNSHLSFSISSLVRWAPTAGLSWSSRNRRSEEHTSELQSRLHLVCRLLLEKKKHTHYTLNGL